MITVSILGNGNVAHHLTTAFLNSEKVAVKQVYARDIDKIDYLKDRVSITNTIELLEEADVYIIAVSDNAIEKVSSKIKTKNGLVVHTSGSFPLHKLNTTNTKGVFYLLQSFSKTKPVNFDEIPFCLEAENEKDLQLLENLANTIGKKVYRINSKQRQHLHVAAVFVNNFVNHLYAIGNDICEAYNVPFEILQPLIKETALKLKELSPKEAQTGPAKRNDTNTIENHLHLLNPKQQEIYQLITKSIQDG